MAQRIVICSDGTGNTWSEQVSNVTRLIKYLDLSRPAEQIVFYDQGIGTDPRLVDAVKAYKAERPTERCALRVLDPPIRFLPLRWVAKGLGLVFGVGLRSNVKQLYRALADSYEDGSSGVRSEIYLIGFSRGAFTVRVLAGLVYRCGLVRAKHSDFSAVFKRAYGLYTPHQCDRTKITSFRRDESPRMPCIRFLGIWDTVKAYGGVCPKSLPHLRHNPIVECVRHALALDEQRSWFIPTSWGRIDSDTPETEDEECHPRTVDYPPQTVEEIWFRGSHSDVGGGLKNDCASKAPLRWMLNEAAAAGLTLTEEGWSAAAAKAPTDVRPCDSLTRGWLISEYVPRLELDNHFRPPKRYFKCGRTGVRHPAQFARQQTVRLHASVGPVQDVVTSYVETRLAPRPASRHTGEPLMT